MSDQCVSRYSSVELFAGAGGLFLGLEAAGCSPLAVFERDGRCCDTLRFNRPLLHGLGQVDVRQVDVRRVDFGEFAGLVDLVTGGPPCQPFSMGGKGKAYDDSRDMFPQAIRAVRETRPKAFMFENVRGLTRRAFSEYFAYIVAQMRRPFLVAAANEEWTRHHKRLNDASPQKSPASERYVVGTLLVDAADYGAPQRRHRVFFVGVRGDLGVEWTPPAPTHSFEALVWDKIHGDYWDRNGVPVAERLLTGQEQARATRLKEKPDALPWVTVREALASLPDPEREPEAAKAFCNHMFQPGARSYPGHTGSPLDQPSKALKAGVNGVPGGENMLRRGDGSVRYFTVRESARLQMFPDDHFFRGSWTESMRQIGNAVPVGLARVMASSLLRQIGPRPSGTVQAAVSGREQASRPAV